MPALFPTAALIGPRSHSKKVDKNKRAKKLFINKIIRAQTGHSYQSKNLGIYLKDDHDTGKN